MAAVTVTAVVVPVRTHDHADAVYPVGPDSLSVYVPAATSLAVTGVEPVAPVTPVVGPVAVNVHADAAAAPPLSLVTFLTSVNFAGLSSLVIEQMTLCPAVTVTWEELFTATVAPAPSTHVQADVV